MSNREITITEEAVPENRLAISLIVQQLSALVAVATVLSNLPDIPELDYIIGTKERLQKDLYSHAGGEGLDLEGIGDLVAMNLAVLEGSVAGIQDSGVIPDKDIPQALIDAGIQWRSSLDKGVAKYDAIS